MTRLDDRGRGGRRTTASARCFLAPCAGNDGESRVATREITVASAVRGWPTRCVEGRDDVSAQDHCRVGV